MKHSVIYVQNSWNNCNIRLKTPGKHVCSYCKTYATSRSNTWVLNTWYTWNIRLQHVCICNIQIYFCNIKMKHLQCTSETYETFGTYSWIHHYNMCNILIYFYNIDINTCNILMKNIWNTWNRCLLSVEQLGDERDAEEFIDISEEANTRHAGIGTSEISRRCEQRSWNWV